MSANTTSHSSFKIYLRLLGYVRPFAKYFLTSILGYIAFSSSQPMLAGILKYFVDGLSASSSTAYRFPLIGEMELIYGIPLLIVLAVAWQGLGSFVGNYYLARVSLGLINDLRQTLFNSLLRLPNAYFDQNNSVFDVKTLAICPILTIVDDMGQNTMPMFWIPYENLRPYINTAYIMTSNINNAMTFTLDDYFRRRMFQGDIFKTQNLMNQPLQAYCPTPDSMKREQERIENQLITFEKSLYLQPDTAQLAADTKGKKSKNATVSARGRKTEAAKESKQKEVKIKAPKAQKSAPVRSVRRRR